MDFDRRRLLAGFALAALAGPAAAARKAAETVSAADAQPGLDPADARDVDRVVAYLQGLTSAKGRFLQTDGRGGEIGGVFYLQRPGRARFDYDPPSGLVIASDGHAVSVVNRRLKTIRSYPLGMTPLALFLARNIRLDRGVRVTQVTRAGGALTVVAEDVDRKNKGNIALRFTEGPIALDGWTITDARGARVTVRLEAFARTAPFAPDLFKLEDPRPRMVDPALAQ